MYKNTFSISSILVVSAAFYPVFAPAMPTAAELKEAQPIVSELMENDIAALKAGKTDAKAVAEKALGYVQEASTDAAKYLLLQGAFYNYTNAREYDRAAETVVQIREVIPDMSSGALAKMISRALRKGRAGGRLSEMLEELERETRYGRLMADVDAELAKSPNDQKLLKMSAEYHALTGDWKDALPKFERVGGKTAEMAAFEKGKPGKLSAAEVGDFWWSYPVAGEGEEAMNGFKRHAIGFYRKALQDPGFKGLKRTIAEKRVASVGGSAPAVAQAKAESVTLAEGVRPSDQTFKLNDKTDLVMVGCPAGTCNGEVSPKWRYLKMPYKISRPFWYAAVPTTFGHWLAFRPQTKIPEVSMKFAGQDGMMLVTPEEARRYFAWLNEKFRDRLPKGYVFRLPTLAEYQYVAMDGTDGMKTYAQVLKEDVKIGRKIAEEKGLDLTDAQIKDLLSSWSNLSARPAGRTTVTSWGVYDASEMTLLLDVYVEGVTARRFKGKMGVEEVFALSSFVGATDPLIYPKRNQLPKGKVELQPFCKFCYGMFVPGRNPIRVVLAPDLLKERKLVP